MVPRPARLAGSALAALLLIGCQDAGDEPGDPENESFSGSKADGFCVDPQSDGAAGILGLVNDERVTVEMLDVSRDQGGAALDRRAAENIAEARPFATLEELDAVPFVGVGTCNALERFACDDHGACERPISVLSWNVEQFPLSASSFDKVREVIEELAPDIVALEEIRDVSAFDKLVGVLDGYRGVVGEGDGFTRPALLTRDDRVSVDSATDLFSGDSHTFPRAPIHAKLTIHVGGVATSLDFLVVHLKAMEDEESHQRRRAACEQLAAFVDDEIIAAGRPAVLAGDWNDRLTDTGDGQVFDAFLDQPERYAFATQPVAEAGDFSHIPFRTLIDHVVIGWPADTLIWSRAAVSMHLEQEDKAYVEEVSDHRPISAIVGLAPAGSSIAAE